MNPLRIRTFCLSLTAIVLMEVMAGFIPPGLRTVPYLLTGLLRVSEILILLILIRFSEGSLTCIGLEEPGRGIQKGLIWSAAFGGLVCAVFLILHLSGMNPLKMFSMRLPEKTGDLILLFLAGGIAGPVAEEIVFRGILYGFLRRWGIIAAFVLSNTLFVLLHSGFGLSQIIGGILFTLAYEKEKNLMTPITIHVLGNTALFSLPLLQ